MLNTKSSTFLPISGGTVAAFGVSPIISFSHKQLVLVTPPYVHSGAFCFNSKTE